MPKEKQAASSDFNDGLSIENICGGAVPERFQRELASVLQNINDPNNPAETKRSLTLQFDFEPFPDRNGAIVTLKSCQAMAPRVISRCRL